MKKIKINGVYFDIHEDTERRYDSYYYRGEVFDHSPVGTRVCGYIQDDNVKVAICQKCYKLVPRVVYGSTAVVGVCVVVLGAVVLGRNVVVPHYMQVDSRDDVIGELDKGVEKASGKLIYSSYATYNGKNVSIFVDGKNKGEVSVSVGDVSSEYLPIGEAYQISIALNLKPEDIAQGTLHIRQGNSVSDHSIVIEYLNDATPKIAAGSIEDRQVTTGGMMKGSDEKETSVGDTTEEDFSDFSVIAPKNIKEGSPITEIPQNGGVVP